jgi:hypothetical protein
MENQLCSAITAMDLSAAFDTVDSDILLSVLASRFGIQGNALSWFDTYLRPRSFKVCVGDIKGSYSSPKIIDFSVPQGSCAGPVLFLAYSSTLADIIPQDVSLYGYADDHATKTTFSSGNLHSQCRAIETLQGCATSIKNWMDKNKLKMNTSKTEFLITGSRQQIAKCSIKDIIIAGDVVSRSEVMAYLGVLFDSTLSFKSHVSNKCPFAMYNIYRIKLIRHYLSIEACKIRLD